MRMIEKIREAATRAFTPSLGLVALAIPVNPSASAYALALTCCCWLLAGRWKQRKPVPVIVKRILPLMLLYVLALLGLLWSTEPEFGWNILRVQLPLLLLPILLVTRPVESVLPGESNLISKIFIAGNLLALILCLINAVFQFRNTGNPDVFSYGDLVYWLNLHPAYSSFYAGLAILMLLGLKPRAANLRRLEWVVFGLLLTYLFLLNSRGTLFAFMLAFVGYTGWRWWLTGQQRRFAIVLGIVLFIGTLISLGLPQNRNRMLSLGKTKTISVEEGSSSLRMEIWRGAWQTLHGEPLSGYGTGAVSRNLVDTYQERGFDAGVQAAFNAHNQYLQTWLMLGIPGLILLVYLLYSVAVASWRDGHAERSAIVVFLAVAMLSEAMLERQMGVLPFAFFMALWYLSPSQEISQAMQSGNPELFPAAPQVITRPGLLQKGGG